MPIAGIYGPDDFGTAVEQPAAAAHGRDSPARAARALSDAIAGMDGGGRARHRASL